MNLVNLLTLLLQTKTKDDRKVLKDSPGCGRLGKESNKECIWGCDWLPVSPFKDITEEVVLQKLRGHLINKVGYAATECIFDQYTKAKFPSQDIQFDDLSTYLGFLADFLDVIAAINANEIPPEVILIWGTSSILLYFKNFEGNTPVVSSLNCLENCKFNAKLGPIDQMIPQQSIHPNYDATCSSEINKNKSEFDTFFGQMEFLNLLFDSIVTTPDNLSYFLYANCAAKFISTGSTNCKQQLMSQVKSKPRNRKRKKHRKHLRKISMLNVTNLHTRISGITGDLIGFSADQEGLRRTLNQYPFLCSLKTRGFRGYHRCGVTLLSVPPNPTILVTAAHCTFICKDSEGYIVETCCCRKETEASNCRQFNSHCGKDPEIQPADPKDLSITCSEWDNSQVSERLTLEDEVVLEVLKYKIHPKFNITAGPIEGSDIAVFFVVEEPKLGNLTPACLPTKKYKTDVKPRGVFAGWKSPLDLGLFFNQNKVGLPPVFPLSLTVDQYRSENILRHKEVEKVDCEDPAWMGSDSFYPKGTICARDPSQGSCFDFGDSGSGLFLERFQGDSSFSWEGLLSSYRGCSVEPNIAVSDNLASGSFKGENPGVFTEGSCYLQWIADSYGMKLADGYATGCRDESGDIEDIDNQQCVAANGRRCLFNTGLTFSVDTTSISFGINEPGIKFNKCVLGGQGLIESQIHYQCITRPATQAELDLINMGAAPIFFLANNFSTEPLSSTCANNCPGVDASDIVAGGLAAFAASGITGITFASLLPILGIGTVAVGGAGLMTCSGPLFCRVGTGCCLVVSITGRIGCPSRC